MLSLLLRLLHAQTLDIPLQRQTEGPRGSDGRKSDKDSDNRNSRENPREGGRESTRGPGPGKGNSREGGKGRGHDDEVGPSAPAKPSGRLSLFDFLEDKLPFGTVTISFFLCNGVFNSAIPNLYSMFCKKFRREGEAASLIQRYLRARQRWGPWWARQWQGRA